MTAKEMNITPDPKRITEEILIEGHSPFQVISRQKDLVGNTFGTLLGHKLAALKVVPVIGCPGSGKSFFCHGISEGLSSFYHHKSRIIGYETPLVQFEMDYKAPQSFDQYTPNQLAKFSKYLSGWLEHQVEVSAQKDEILIIEIPAVGKYDRGQVWLRQHIGFLNKQVNKKNKHSTDSGLLVVGVVPDSKVVNSAQNFRAIARRSDITDEMYQQRLDWLDVEVPGGMSVSQFREHICQSASPDQIKQITDEELEDAAPRLERIQKNQPELYEIAKNTLDIPGDKDTQRAEINFKLALSLADRLLWNGIDNDSYTIVFNKYVRNIKR